VLLAAFVVWFGYTYRTSTASGADSYGYLSQADLWRAGNLHISQPFMQEFPWPKREWTGAPMGYRPAPGEESNQIVPIYSPGLPVLMAVAKTVVGHRAMFWIVPLFGGLFVLATYGIGLRFMNAGVSLLAALLAAASPMVLFMSMWPMTDLAVAACWATAAWALLGSSRRHALVGGLAAAVAITIRPNLIVVGMLMGLWTIARDMRRGGEWWRVDRALMFALGAVPGVAAIMMFNKMLYGSPFVSGYGTLGDVLHLQNFSINVAHYAAWIAESQSPAVFLGLVPLAFPIRQLWQTRDRAFDAALFTAMAIGILTCHLFFMPLDEWWYLRFLLTMFPGMFVTMCWLLFRAGASAHAGNTLVAASRVVLGLAVVGVVTWWSVTFSRGKHFEDVHDGERRFITIGQLVRDHTEPNAIIFSLQHAGSIRYYGERMTFKYDSLEPGWLDTAVEYFRARGAHPYLLLDEWEVDHWKQYFGNGSARGRLEVAPVFEEQWPTHIWFLDLERVGMPEPGTWPYLNGFYLPRPPADLPPAPKPVFQLR